MSADVRHERRPREARRAVAFNMLTIRGSGEGAVKLEHGCAVKIEPADSLDSRIVAATGEASALS
jgi:hypothetical protein